jgi:hypothetical protein
MKVDMGLLILQTFTQLLAVIDWKPYKHAELFDVAVSAKYCTVHAQPTDSFNR